LGAPSKGTGRIFDRSLKDILAAKIAAACRCAQEVFELLPDPTD
jgi:hypothetical protein